MVNELKQICTGEGTGILVGGQYYKADSNGDILIPYSTKTLSEDSIVIHGDFADIVPIKVEPELYAFLTSLLFNEEAFMPGASTKLIIHPKLIFNGRAISISYVKKGKVTINSTNDSGVKSSTVYSDIKFNYEDDVVVDYVVPAKLKQVEVLVEGVITLVDGTELRVSTNEFIQFHKFENKDVFFDLYMIKSASGHTVKLLGKNGEPLVEKLIQVKLYSRYI